MITWKLLFDGEGIIFLIWEVENVVRELFWWGKWVLEGFLTTYSCKEKPEECTGSVSFNNFEKREIESTFFQSNKIIATISSNAATWNKQVYNVKDGYEAVKFWIMPNLQKIIHSFPGKKHLRSSWKLNCNPEAFLDVCYHV